MRKCYAYGSHTTCNKNRNWYLNYDGDNNVLCNNCYTKYIAWRNPAVRKKWNPILSPMRIWFLGKRISLSWNPHKYICQICNAVKGVDCHSTQLHHYFYVPCMPWACTVELCIPCHIKQHNHRDLKGRFS